MSEQFDPEAVASIVIDRMSGKETFPQTLDQKRADDVIKAIQDAE